MNQRKRKSELYRRNMKSIVARKLSEFMQGVVMLVSCTDKASRGLRKMSAVLRSLHKQVSIAYSNTIINQKTKQLQLRN